MSTDVAQADAVQPANGDTEQVSFQLSNKKKKSSKVHKWSCERWCTQWNN